MSQAVAPLIPASTAFYNQEDRVLRSSNIETNSLTDYVATLQNGQLTNLNYPPINEKDAATVQYVNNTTTAGGIINSIQYDNNSVFGGSPNLTFDGFSLTLNGTYTDGIFSIAGNYINNLNNPINQLDIATKSYVDEYSKKLTETTINSDTSNVYAAQYMVNGIILRNSLTLTDTVLEDFTDTAANIIQKYPGIVVGSVARFTLQNSNTNNVVISLIPGLNVTFVGATNDIISNVLLEPNYTLYSRIIITNKTYGVQAVSINIDSISWTMAYMSPFFSRMQEPAATDYTVLVATTEPISLINLQTVDSYVTTVNDRVLVKNQLSSTDNGIYIASVGSWSRSTDLPNGSNAFNINVAVTGGTTGSLNTGLIFNSAPFTDPLIVGSYNITFSTVIQNSITAFSSSLPYKVSNVFLEPQMNNTSNTSLSYQYSASDIKTGLVIRDPGTNTTDTFEDFSSTHTLFQASSFMIQNISSNIITIGPSNNWTYIPTSIVITPTTSCLFWINMNSGQILNSIGLFSLI